MTDKTALRHEIRARAASLSADYLASSDLGIFRRITELPEYISANTVFMYYSEKHEPDTRRLLSHTLDIGKSVVLPRVLGDGEMAAIRIFDPSELEKGAFGLYEPPESGERADIRDIDLVIVPAVAFDRLGYRLGRGGGYYDRFLSASNAFSVGLARGELLLDEVPREKHDIPVRCVITENEQLRFVAKAKRAQTASEK